MDYENKALHKRILQIKEDEGLTYSEAMEKAQQDPNIKRYIDNSADPEIGAKTLAQSIRLDERIKEIRSERKRLTYTDAYELATQEKEFGGLGNYAEIPAEKR